MFSALRQKFTRLHSDKDFSEILSGSAWALFARLFATGLGLVSSILIARLYGAQVLGIVNIINSFLQILTIFTLLGTNVSLLRFIPEHLTKYSPSSAFKVYKKTHHIVLIVSIVMGVLLFFFSDLIAEEVFSKSHFSYYFALTSIFIIFKSLTILNTQATRGLKMIRAFALMLVMPHAAFLILLIVLSLFWSTNNVPVYALLGGFAIAGTIGWLIVEYSFQKLKKPGEPIKRMRSKSILSVSLPMLMTATMYFMIGQIGVIFVGIFRSEAEAGYFGIAVRLATLTVFTLQAINSILAPKFSELFQSGKTDELFKVAKRSSKLIFFSTLPILAGFVLFGKPLLNMVYGPEFVVVYPALILLVIGQFASSISGSTGIFMNMTGNQKIFRNIIAVVSVINISLNLSLIPTLGIIGAAFSMMLSTILWNVALLFYIKTKFGKTICYLPLLNLKKAE